MRSQKSLSEFIPGPVEEESAERRYSIFEANLEKVVDPEKENRRMQGRRRGALADLGLVRKLFLYFIVRIVSEVAHP